MTPLLFTAVHGRREILQQVIDHHASIPWLKFAVCSTDEEVDFMCENGFYAFRYDNEPLGRKVDMGIRAALGVPWWTHIVHIGSDDFLAPEYIARVNDYNVDFAAVKDLYFVCSKTWKVTRHRYAPNEKGKLFIGAGRILSRNAIQRTIDKMGCLYDHHKTKGLDANSEAKLAACGYKPIEIESELPLVMDLKSEQNIWKFGSFADRSHQNEVVTFEEMQKQIGYEKPNV
jgi:hypothetical protein